MDRDIIKELSKWIYNYRACVENHAGCDVFIIPYDNTENTAEELYIKHIKPYQNQKAIECLKEVKEKSFGLREGILIFDNPQMQVIFNNIDNKIKELEENNEDKH